jgi:RES domain-containing protein
MRLYRFGFKNYIDDLSGTGGLYKAGRWHHKGTRIVYFSETVSLAKLEVLANATRIPKSYRLLTVEIPDKISILEINRNELPEGWDDFPPKADIKQITEEWIAENKYVFMKIPSVHSPVESNFLLNPQHQETDKIKIVSIEPHQFDERLKKASKSISDILSEIWGRGKKF